MPEMCSLNVATMSGLRNCMASYQLVKMFGGMLSRFDTGRECDGQTDGQYRTCVYASRGKT